jgi:hypothetical protein
MFRWILLCVVFNVFDTSGAYGQSSYENLPKLMPSSLISDIEALAGRKPASTAGALAALANTKLATSGFEFETDPCDMESTPTTDKYPGEYGGVYHVYKINEGPGKERSFLAREPGDAPCGCWLNLPVTAATQKRLVLVSDGGPFEIKPPKKLLLEEAMLVDASLRKVVRTWVVPNGGPPDGISTDGKKLYIAIEKTPLLLEIADTGMLRFIPRKTPAVITKFTDLTKYPKDRQNDYLGFRRFTKGKIIFTIKFSNVCT